MATNFPATLDTSTTLPVEGATVALATNHVTAHQNIQDALEAVEAKIGVDSSAVTTTHDYKLSEVTVADKAVGKTASQVLTNKTLTSPVINVGSDATGDIYYRNAGILTRLAIGANSTILKIAAGIPSWAAETVTVDASTTVKGIVEAATSAEITAGTATGATGAVLVVTPDALASSTPVFNGSGLTSLTAVAKQTTVTANVALASSTTETTLISTSIAGGVLGTSNAVRAKLYFSALNVSSTSNNVTFRMKYGATTITSPAFATNATNGAGTGYSGFIEAILYSAGTTTSQEGMMQAVFSTSTFGNNSGTPSGVSSSTFTGVGTATETSSGALTFAITAQFSNNGANDNLTMVSAVVEKIV